MKKLFGISLIVSAIALTLTAAPVARADDREEIEVWSPAAATSTVTGKILDTSRYGILRVTADNSATGNATRTLTVSCHASLVPGATQLFAYDPVTLATPTTGNMIVLNPAYFDPDNSTTPTKLTNVTTIPHHPCDYTKVTVAQGLGTVKIRVTGRKN